MNVVLDSWAVLALLRDEPGADEIERAVESGGAVVSWITLGDVFHVEARIAGDAAAAAALEQIQTDIEPQEVDAELVLSAARVKSRHELSYADAFAVALAERLRLPLMTGDEQILALDGEVTLIDPRVH